MPNRTIYIPLSVRIYSGDMDFQASELDSSPVAQARIFLNYRVHPAADTRASP